MRKILYIATALVIIVFIFFLLSLLPELKPKSKSLPVPTSTIPEAGTIQISKVPVKNFYKNAVKIDKQGDVYLVNNSNYQIVYLDEFNIFMITITGSPFESLRPQAEAEFLEKTGMSKEAACALNVQVGTPYFANPDFSGKYYPLSFCAK